MLRIARTIVSRVAPFVAALAVASCSSPNTPAGGGLVGQSAPKFAAEPIGGAGPKSLEEAKGKIVILDFWATFCGPCKKSFPKYQELADQFGGDVSVLAVSVDEPTDTTPDAIKKTTEDIKAFVKETGVKFAIVWDKDHTIVKSYDVTKMPTSFIIDRDGKVRFTHAAYESGEDAKIAEEVKGLVGK